MNFGLCRAASAPAAYASRIVLPPSLQSSLPAGWLAFTGRELNPLDRYKRFQITSLVPLFWICPGAREVSFEPPSSFTSLDHLVGGHKQFVGYFKAEHPGGGEVDDEIELGRLLDRDVGWLRSAQNLIDIVASAPEEVWEVGSIGHQTSRFDVLPLIIGRRQSRAERQGVDANPVGDHERVASDIKGLRAALERLERGSDIFGAPNFECDDIEAERLGRRLNLAHLHSADGLLTLAKTANRRRPGTTSRKSSTCLPAISADWFDNPVTLRPGRARLATRPAPTG